MKQTERYWSRFRWAIVISPAAVASILAALWLSGTATSEPDLRFSAPVVARPGATIGLRAWLVREEGRGQTVIDAVDVEVELVRGDGTPLAQAWLHPSRVQGSEGWLAVPEHLDGVFDLVATARIEGRAVSVARALYVGDSIESRAPAGRAVNAFQIYELGPIRAVGRAADVVLDPRIEEGACTPDLPCWLSVWVADHEGEVRLRPRAGLPPAPVIRFARHGFARFALMVAGSEALVDVELLGPDRRVIAAREVRLPVVLGGLVQRAEATEGGIRVDWQQLGGASPVLIDVFREDRWVAALSLDPSSPSFEWSESGLWRVQARTDLFSDDTAGVSHVVVPSPRGPKPLVQAARFVLAHADRQGLDPLAMAVLEGDVSDAAEDATLDALFAVPNFDVVSTGLGTSSRLAGDQARETMQERRRWWAAGAILAIGLIVSLALFRVEELARREARALLSDFGDDPSAVPARGPSGRWLWAFVFLVFVAIAVLALSKRWF